MSHNTSLALAFSASLLVGAALSACDARVQIESNGGKPVTVKGMDGQPLTISEICYDGVVYLVNGRGGMAPKVNKTDDGALMGMSQSPFVKCR